MQFQKPATAAAGWLGERVKTGFQFEIEGTLYHFLAEAVPHTCATLAGCSLVSARVYETMGFVTVGIVVYVLRKRVKRDAVAIEADAIKAAETVDAALSKIRNPYR
jgi:hypothetical protein